MTLVAILAWLRRVPTWAWAALAAVVLLAGAYRWAYSRGAESVQAEWDAERTALALQAEAQKAEAAAKEAKDAAAFAVLADNLRKENEDAKRNANAIIADLRRGTIRLRDRFTCPRAMPQAAGSPAGSDEAGQSGFTVADAETAIRIASDGDAAIRQLTACQAILSAERK